MTVLRRCHRSRLARDERGVSMVEFAFVAPVIATLVVGITDVSRAFAAKLHLEQAASRAVEKAAVGNVQTDYTFLKAEAAAAAGVPESSVTISTWLECDGVKQPTFDGACTGDQMVTRYLDVTVAGKFTPTFAYGKLFTTAADGTVTLTGDAALRLQ